MFISKVDANMELRLLSTEHAEQFFKLVYENRQRLIEWMFWVCDDYSLADGHELLLWFLSKETSIKPRSGGTKVARGKSR